MTDEYELQFRGNGRRQLPETSIRGAKQNQAEPIHENREGRKEGKEIHLAPTVFARVALAVHAKITVDANRAIAAETRTKIVASACDVGGNEIHRWDERFIGCLHGHFLVCGQVFPVVGMGKGGGATRCDVSPFIVKMYSAGGNVNVPMVLDKKIGYLRSG